MLIDSLQYIQILQFTNLRYKLQYFKRVIVTTIKYYEYIKLI